MGNSVFKLLGGARIEQICRERGLEEEGIRKVKAILDQWERVVEEKGLGQREEKIEAAINIIGNDPARAKIINALLQINAEFAAKHMEGIG